VAAAFVDIRLEIDQALQPIIGDKGVAALFDRSLGLSAAAFPWLAQGPAGGLAGADPAALKALLAAQPASEAVAGGNALLQSFHELLASLVGRPLTDRLLRSVWAHSRGIPTHEDHAS
jgi:DNA-binding GntR family transcriptional regulator